MATDPAALKRYVVQHRLVRRDGSGQKEAVNVLTTMFGASPTEARRAIAAVLDGTKH